jgi:hypothetical protein
MCYCTYMGKRTREKLDTLSYQNRVILDSLRSILARLPERTGAVVDFTDDPFWQSHYLEAHPDGTMITRERTPAQETNQSNTDQTQSANE